jgi:hypothetical protein
MQTRMTILIAIALFFLSAGPTCRERSTQSANRGNDSTNMKSTQNNNSSPSNAEVVWGGPHVRLVLTSDGGEIEFDCAHGKITEPLKKNEEGAFDVAGTFVSEAGPMRSDESARIKPARYSGRMGDKNMTLIVTLTDSNEKLDEFSLTRGNQGRLRKCK